MPFILDRYPRGPRAFVLALLLLPCLLSSSGIPPVSPKRGVAHRVADDKKWRDILDSVSCRLLNLENWQEHAPADSAGYITESVRRMKIVLCNIQRLINSRQTYGIRYISGGSGYTYYDPHEQMIIFHIDSIRVTNFIHEATHGGQFENGSIAFTKDDTLGFGDDCGDEAEAYKNEFAYDPSTVIDLDRPALVHSYADITKEWVKEHPAYKFVPLDPLDVKTDSNRLDKAYPWYIGRWKSRSRYPLMDDRFYIFRKVKDDSCQEAGKPRMGA